MSPGCAGSAMPLNGFFKKHSQCYYLISVAEGLIEASVLQLKEKIPGLFSHCFAEKVCIFVESDSSSSFFMASGFASMLQIASSKPSL